MEYIDRIHGISIALKSSVLNDSEKKNLANESQSHTPNEIETLFWVKLI